jgi:hypothetical protein
MVRRSRPLTDPRVEIKPPSGYNPSLAWFLPGDTVPAFSINYVDDIDSMAVFKLEGDIGFWDWQAHGADGFDHTLMELGYYYSGSSGSYTALTIIDGNGQALLSPGYLSLPGVDLTASTGQGPAGLWIGGEIALQASWAGTPASITIAGNPVLTTASSVSFLSGTFLRIHPNTLAVGPGVTATGGNSVAFGSSSSAGGNNPAAFGLGTSAPTFGQFVLGQ